MRHDTKKRALFSLFWRDLIRIVSVEFVQNWPILAGIMLAIAPQSPLSPALLILLGALLSALFIGSTDPPKYAQRPGPISMRDLVNNTAAFCAAGFLYLAYYHLIRSGDRWPLDAALGLALGLVVGLFQAKFVDERRMTRAALFHMLALGLSGCLVLTLAGLLASTCPPLLSATVLDGVMTLIIVWVDYRHVIGSNRPLRTT